MRSKTPWLKIGRDGGTDAAVSTALGGVLRSKTPWLKIGRDADCFSRHGWRCYYALGGVLRSETPWLKIGRDADFEPVYKNAFFPYPDTMFVSVAIDPGSESRAKELADLLGQYGLDRIQRGLWESTFVSPDTLTRLKRDLDKATDAFDRIRIFQFPVEGTLALSTLRGKKWRRMVARGGADTPNTAPAARQRPASAGKPAASKPAAAQKK